MQQRELVEVQQLLRELGASVTSGNTLREGLRAEAEKCRTEMEKVSLNYCHLCVSSMIRIKPSEWIA